MTSPAVKPCPNCGSSVSVDARFCGQCGRTIATEPRPDQETTQRRVPITLDEATADPPKLGAPAAKPTVIGNASEFSQTVTDTSSVEEMLASLEWNPPTSDPKLPAVVAPPPESVSEVTVMARAPAQPPVLELQPESQGEITVIAHVAAADLIAAEAAAAAAAGKAPITQPQPPPPPEAPTRGPMFGKTMIGGSITASEVMAEHERTKAGRPPSEHQTMIGTPALNRPAFDFDPPPVAPAPPPQPQQPSQPPPADPQAYRPAFKTMMGVAIPGIAPIRDSDRGMAASQAPAPPRSNPHFPVVHPHPQPSHVPVPPPSARPYTAPLAATPYAQSRAPQPPPSGPHIVPPPAPLIEEPLPQSPVAANAKKGGISALAVVAIVFLLVLLGGGAAAVVFLRAGAPLTAKARLDESGKESLEIRCESCPDGTKISLGASSASVAASNAILALPAPLSIGDNDLELAIDRPGAGRDEKVKVHVPIAYRVKADLTTLSAFPPAITVRVEASPGAEVTVDTKPVELDASGKGSYALDVSSEALGPSDDQKAIDRKIPFSVKRKGMASADPGELVVRAAIIPLHLDAPGAELTTDRTTANVAGQTKPGGTLTIDGQSVAVDATGHFAIRAELPAEGEKTLTIVASAPPLAPRTIRAKVTRVASLETAAQTLDDAKPLGFDGYSADPTKKADQIVAVNGEILEIRVTQGYSVMVVEEKKDCAAGGGCVVRFVHGEEVRAGRGDTIRAYGKLAGTVSWNGKTVPAIVGTLAIAVPKGTTK